MIMNQTQPDLRCPECGNTSRPPAVATDPARCLVAAWDEWLDSGLYSFACLRDAVEALRATLDQGQPTAAKPCHVCRDDSSVRVSAKAATP